MFMVIRLGIYHLQIQVTRLYYRWKGKQSAHVVERASREENEGT